MKLPSNRFIKTCSVTSVAEVGENTLVLSFRFPEVARLTLPGQFVNIRVAESYLPLLRRPFSVYRTTPDTVEVIFNVVGEGTKILSGKKKDDSIDVLGPLGTAYVLDQSFETALLVAGGLGVAPLPILTDALRRSNKKIFTFLGARSHRQLVPTHLENVSVATDDGSKGFKGTVVDLLGQALRTGEFVRPKIFACGPNRMLGNVSVLAASRVVPCEVSLESAMACGFGICQGCPVERARREDDRGRRYGLVCKDGPVFNSTTIMIE